MKKITAWLLMVCLLTAALPAAAESAPKITELTVHNGVVRFTTDRDITGYCFSKIDKIPALDSYDWMDCSGTQQSVFKKDDTYYLFVRAGESVGTSVQVEVTSPYYYGIDAEGLTPIEKLGASDIMDIEAENKRLYENVTEAGMYTREGVLTAALSLLTIFAEKGYAVRYQGCGSYQQQDDWGINPDWGTKLVHPTQDGNGKYYYTGMQCVASVVWAYKQAGINISNAGTGYKIGLVASRKKSGDNRIDYRKARGGDVIANDAHYLMIVDRLDTDNDGVDDAFLTYEMKAPSLVLLVHTFKSIRYREIYNMDAVYENESRVVKRQRIFGETVYIPESYYPEALLTAMESADTRRTAHKLLYGFGF